MDTVSQQHHEFSPDSALVCVNGTSINDAASPEKVPGNSQPMVDEPLTSTFDTPGSSKTLNEFGREHYIELEPQQAQWFFYNTFVRVWLQVTTHPFFVYLLKGLNCLRSAILRHFSRKITLLFVTTHGPKILQHLYTNPSYLCYLPSASNTVFCPQYKSATSTQPISQWLNLTALMHLQGDMDDTASRDCDYQWMSMVAELRDKQNGAEDLQCSVKHSSLGLAADIAGGLQEHIDTEEQAIEFILSMNALACATTRSLSAINRRGLLLIQQANGKRAPSVFSLSWFRRNDGREEAVKQAFLQILTETSTFLQNLLHGCDIIQGLLRKMDRQILNIKDLASYEERIVFDNHMEVLFSLWTFLGANRAELHMFKRNLAKLGNVSQWTAEAQSSVATIRDCFAGMSEEIKLLQKEVSRPAILGRVDESWLQVELQALRNGQARLEARLNRGGNSNSNQLDGP